MAPVLYFLPPSPPCRSILLLGKMLDLDFELKTLNILDGEQLKPEFIEINPQHTIPTIDDAGLVLWESRAILAYLVAAYGKNDTLYPKDVRQRALVDQRLQFDLGTLYQRMMDYHYGLMLRGLPLEEPKKERLVEALGISWFEAFLKGRTWCATTKFTIADLSLVITVSQIDAFDAIDLSEYPRIVRWYDKCKKKLEPYGYEEINQSGADMLGEMFKSKLEN